MIRPTLRAASAFAATQSLALPLLFWRRETWPLAIGLAVLVLMLIGVDALLGASKRRLHVTTAAPPRMFVGTSGEIQVAITQTGPPVETRFEILLELSGDVEPPKAVFAVTGAGGEAQAKVGFAPRRRGQVDLDAVWLRWTGPLGFAQRMTRVSVGEQIDVVPDVRGVRSVGLQFLAQESLAGVKAQQQRGEGAEFESLRDHAFGLDARFIDWKRSAKHRKLLSKEFRTERNHHVILAFDAGHLMMAPIDGVTRLDHAINAGLLLGYAALRSGDLVGAFVFDAIPRQYVEPGRGMPWFARLQRSASAIAYRGLETNFTLALAELNARLRRRALVVLFTEFVDETTAQLLLDNLAATANRHAVVFVTLRDTELGALFEAPPDRFEAVAEAVVAHDFLRERAIVLERLERLGAHCLECSPRALQAQLLNRYLSLKQRGFI